MTDTPKPRASFRVLDDQGNTIVDIPFPEPQSAPERPQEDDLPIPVGVVPPEAEPAPDAAPDVLTAGATQAQREAAAERSGDPELIRLTRANQHGLTPRRWAKFGYRK